MLGLFCGQSVCNAIAEAEEVTDSWAEMAIDALKPLPSGSVKSALEAFARAVVDRKG